MNTLGWGLIAVGLGAAGVVFCTVCWRFLDGYEARRDARRRNMAHRL